jgi:phage FluMu gp28-like protein
MFKLGFRYFLPYQARWAKDTSSLRICVKARQVGISYVDAYDSVRKAAAQGGKDVWIMSRDEIQSRQYFLNCKRWARVLGHAASDHGEQLFATARGKPIQVRVLSFASGATIYALSSNPDAIVGKSGHVKLDEFALHRDQRTLYAVAKPVIQWGGTLSIISTHRGRGTAFNQILTDIKERGNPMRWSLHEIPIQLAVEQGIVEKINAVAGRHESRADWLARQRAECIDEEQWLQEYCCKPADENSAFITYDMITAAEEPGLRLMTLDQFIDYAARNTNSTFFLGMDVARKQHLCVIDVGEKIGSTMYDRLRIELLDRPYHEMEDQLYRLLDLPQLQHACIDASGIGSQLSERAQQLYPWKVQPVTFTAAEKVRLAYGLHQDFTDGHLRIPYDDKLRADLRGIKKEVTASEHIRFAGEAEDSHCDRFWAKALRQEASHRQNDIGSELGY